MQLLKTYPACSDARSVMLELIDGTEADANCASAISIRDAAIDMPAKSP